MGGVSKIKVKEQVLENAYTRPELSYNPTFSIGRRDVEPVLTELRSYDE